MAIKRNSSFNDVAPREVRDIVSQLRRDGHELKPGDPVWWVGHVDERPHHDPGHGNGNGNGHHAAEDPPAPAADPE